MDKRIEDTSLGKEVLDAINKKEAETFRKELQNHLEKGKWFITGAEVIVQNNPVYFDQTGAWWIWNHQTACWEEKDETDILNMCRKTLSLLGDTSIKHGARLLEALRQVSRDNKPKDPPLHYIQFGKEFTDINTGETIPSTPSHFSTNNIPWNKGLSTQTPIMDELIVSWVGEENLQTVYEIIAYCTYRDYPIHRIFCFVGTGANGKTRLLKIIEKFLGTNNKSSVTLKKIGNNDFALYPLYRKLVCFVGETAHHRLESTEVIKALSGQDPVSFEAKGRNAFTATNYAKLIVGTNVLPPSTDTSRGWFRRWFVLRFPNEFQEGEDVLNRIPEGEYENLATKCIKLLPNVLKNGGFTHEGTIDERRETYIQNSNPIRIFLDENYYRDPNENIRYSDVYLAYLAFLAEKKLRRISKKEFTAMMEDEGLETDTQTIKDENGMFSKKIYIISGIVKKQKSSKSTESTDVSIVSNFPYREIESNRGLGTFGTFSTLDCLNDVYTGNEGKNSLPVESFIGKNTLLENIRSLGEADHQLCIDLFPGEPVDQWITELLRDGELLQFKPGKYKVLS